jgi:hypothetical protein
VAGIRVDSGWISGYATTVERAGDDLAAALTALHDNPLTSASFGEVGKQLGSAEAYHGASATLRQQLGRAADALHSAATKLRTIADEHSSSDQRAAAVLRRADQG